MSTRRVDQFHSGTAVGDAVTQQLLFLRGELRALGYESNIYAQHIAPQLTADVRDIRDYAAAADDVLLVHHSIGHTAFERVLTVPSQLITVFHNITPERFFDDASTRYFIRLGRQQLRRLAERSVSGIAVSNHNRREMYDAGFSTVDVLPVRTDFTAPRARRSAQQSSREWLFVGRIAPHKHQLEVVRAFAAYRQAFDRTASLTLIGDTSIVDYADLVADEAKRLGVRQAVHIAGKVSDDELWRGPARRAVRVPERARGLRCAAARGDGCRRPRDRPRRGRRAGDDGRVRRPGPRPRPVDDRRHRPAPLR